MSNFNRQLAPKTVAFVLGFALFCDAASAGPLIDWLLNSQYSNQQVVTSGSPVVVGNASVPAVQQLPYATIPYSPTQNATVMPTYAQPAYGLPANSPYTAGFVPLPQANAALLPTGSYQTTLNNVPTTYYRPVTTLDPNTGTTVTTLQPCTSYQQQVLRVPLLNPSSFMSPYGGYGASQNGFAGLAGSSVAASSGQSTLSIASELNTKSISPVQQIPTSGIVVTPNSNTYATGFIPQNSFVAPAAGMAPITAQSSPYATNYPTLKTNSVGSSYVQPDGTIVTPLGSYPSQMSAAPTQSIPTQSIPTQSIPTQSIPTQSFQDPLSTTIPSLPQQSANYAPSNFHNNVNTYTPVLPEAPVLPYQSALPENTTQPRNPAIPYSSLNNGATWQQNPSAVANPLGSNSNINTNPNSNNPSFNVPAPLQDPASVTQPTLPPVSQNQNFGADSNNVSMGRMVPIDRPTPVFSRSPVGEESTLSSAFVNDRQLNSPFADSANPNKSPSFSAPQLLEPPAQSGPSVNGIRPPEGYTPKPYWRSEQHSTSPKALFNDGEKSAYNAKSPQAVQTITEQQTDVKVLIASDRNTLPIIPSLEYASISASTDAVTNNVNTNNLQANPIWGQQIAPSSSIQISDGFTPVK